MIEFFKEVNSNIPLSLSNSESKAPLGNIQKEEKNSDPISLKSAQQIFFPGGNKVEKEKGREREVSSCVCMRLCVSACVSMCGCESVQVCKCVCVL